MGKKEQSVFGFYERIRQYGHPAPSGRNITEIETGMVCWGDRIRQSANCDRVPIVRNGTGRRQPDNREANPISIVRPQLKPNLAQPRTPNTNERLVRDRGANERLRGNRGAAV